MLRLFGIPNCDTVKRARLFLENHNLSYEFVDFKKIPPTLTDLERWKAAFGEWPVNKKGPTFRKHAEAYEGLSDAKRGAFIITNSSMIKRPILEVNGKVKVFGFDEAKYRELAK